MMIRTYPVVLLGLLMLCFGAAHAPPAEAVLRGICQDTWVQASPARRNALLQEYSQRLRAQVVRITVEWPRAEPERGVYDKAYLARLESAIAAAREHGLRIMVLVHRVPRWASDQEFWNDPPFEQIAPGYQPYYPMRGGALSDFRRFAHHLAARFKDKVAWYECWCEPNNWTYLYPQQCDGDKDFGPRTYLRYLKAFNKGIKAGDPGALVLAGVTSPIGINTKRETSPLRFARRLKALNANRHFDGYSHHPYPVGFRPKAPNRPNRIGRYYIGLHNARKLLRVFPCKPFYFDEYGYTTQDMTAFAGGRVTRRQQARYLTMAYRMTARLPRVKMLLWFQWKDDPLAGGKPTLHGHYLGLRDAGGTRKPSWYAFRKLSRLK